MENITNEEMMDLENPATALDFPLTDEERDALGEIGNICMGTSATTLSILLDKTVNITTPHVTVHSSSDTLGHYQKPFFVVDVSYVEGVDGYNVLLMKESDVKIITSILMGEDGVVDPDTEVDELHFSAISEVMNQMVGSSATSLSNVVGTSVNISPPVVKRIVMEEDTLKEVIGHDDTIIKISFLMEIVGVLSSELMQVMPYDFGRKLAATLIGDMEQSTPPAPQPAPQPMPQPQAPPMQAAPVQAPPGPKVSVQGMQYQSFDNGNIASVVGIDQDSAENLGLLMDVPLQVTVELGQSRRSIKDILGFHMGSVVVLDRAVGEMVDILVNGKLYAKGEVVAIDDTYGVRVTEIVAKTPFVL